VQNLGNSRETFSLAVAPLPGGPGGVLFDLDQATLSIAPFSQAYATVEVTVRTYAGAGNVSARVSAISQTGDTLGQTLTVSIPALHGVAVEAPARVSGRQGTSTVAVVSVENVGNVDEPVVLAVDTAPAGISVTGWSGPVVLARGEIRMLTITLSISSSAAPGLVDVALLLDSAQGGGLAPVVTALHLDVRPAETPAQSFVPGAGGFAAGVALCAAAAGAAWARKLPRRPF
jgi:uncharacterized membrane protein